MSIVENTPLAICPARRVLYSRLAESRRIRPPSAVAGVGDSGVGREGGTFSREFFTEPKAVVIQIDRG